MHRISSLPTGVLIVGAFALAVTIGPSRPLVVAAVLLALGVARVAGRSTRAPVSPPHAVAPATGSAVAVLAATRLSTVVASAPAVASSLAATVGAVVLAMLVGAALGRGIPTLGPRSSRRLVAAGAVLGLAAIAWPGAGTATAASLLATPAGRAAVVLAAISAALTVVMVVWTSRTAPSLAVDEAASGWIIGLLLVEAAAGLPGPLATVLPAPALLAAAALLPVAFVTATPRAILSEIARAGFGLRAFSAASLLLVGLQAASPGALAPPALVLAAWLAHRGSARSVDLQRARTDRALPSV